MTFFYVMFSGIIYLRISPSNTGYVGQTIDEAGRDWEFGNLNKRYGGAAIEAARRKYPPSLWRKFTICTVNARNRDELRVWLDALEVYYIWAFQTADKRYGYNAKLGGNSRGGYRHSEETLRKIGAGNKGKAISPEARAIIASKLRGRKRPLSACVKTSLAMRGHVWSTETLAKRAAALRGKKRSPDSLLFSDEYRQRRRELSTGRRHSQDAKNKISVSKGYRPVLVYDRVSGSFLGEFQTRVEAASFGGILPHHISRAFSAHPGVLWVCIKNHVYAWSAPSLSRVSLCDNGYTPVLPPSQRSISCVSLRGKDMGCDSLSGWASRLGISRHSILRVCNGDRNVAGGYVFRYVD